MRHQTHLEKQNDENFPFYFDVLEAERALKFARLSFFGKGKLRGKPFVLEGWQAALLWQVYGWHRKDTSTRKYRQVYIKVARKNGKTEFLSLIGNYGFLLENFSAVERDPDIFWGATKKDQAKIGWKIQKSQLSILANKSNKVAKYAKILTHEILTANGNGSVAYLGKDSDKEDGLNPYYALIDEYHAHPSDDIINVLISGMGARVSPLLWIITTAGFNPQSPCARFENRCKDIVNGRIDNENILPWIFDLDEDDDWNDPKNWCKANPNLGVSVNLEYLETQYQDAITMGAEKEFNFLTKNLNKWVTSRVTFVKDAIYKQNMGEIDQEALKGKICYAGLDLASDRDTTAYVLYFPVQEGVEKATVLYNFFVPLENIRERSRRDGVPYLDWVNEGWLHTTPGNNTDYNWIKKFIMDTVEKYMVKGIGYDRWNASQLVIDLIDAGLTMTKYAQGPPTMNAPCREYRRLMLNYLLNVGQNPVARWQNSNITIKKDSNDNIKFDKEKSIEKIDGKVALAMAIKECMEKHSDQGSVYNDRDLIIF